MQNNFVEKAIILFTECFGDDVSVVRELFSITDLHSISIYRDGELAAMATLVPISCESEFCGFYIFGVCVRKKFRSLGLFRKIMGLCEEYACREGASFVCLIPADEGLARTYEKMGYNTSISLVQDKKTGELPLSSLSDGFFKYANTDTDCKSTFGFGLAKHLDGKYADKSLAFAHFFGER